ncbi:RNB-domain-containing protein [Dentipellis sp. KUC8613]|nr:RNB-domain-containing protein [Dentipellis sp. KUC8613]
MHRRSTQCTRKISSRLRPSGHVSPPVDSVRFRSSHASGAYSRPGVEGLTRQLIGSAAHAKRPKPSSELRAPLTLVNALLDKAQLPAKAPVVEPDALVDSEALDKIEDSVLYGHQLEIPPGSFVEVRRNRRIWNGVALARMSEDGVPRIIVLTSSGTIQEPASQDITFLINGFLDQKAIDRCGSHIQAISSSEIQARSEAVRQINEFLKRVEQKEKELRIHLKDLYETLAPKNTESWGLVTAGKVVNLIQPGKLRDYTTRMAIHRHLMLNSHEFLADSSQYLKSHMFYVRPRAQLQRLTIMCDLVHRQDRSLLKFAEKARLVIQHSQQVAAESRGEPPSSSLSEQFEYDAHDRTILKFLVDASHNTRSLQKDPYLAPTAAIIKLIDPSASLIDDSKIYEVLVQLGAFAPWQDLASLRMELGVYKEAEEDSSMVKKQTAMVERYLSQDKPQPDEEPVEPLDRGDFYATDLAESIRHDFGNLPVYVIDDFGAEELDDGISIERIPSEPGNVWIHVHVADPTAILPPTHLFSSKARRQGETLYFHHRSYSMLPRALIRNGLSLGNKHKEGEPHRVLTFSSKLDAAGDLVDYKVRAGLIRNTRLMTYGDVNLVLPETEEFVHYPFGQPNNLPEPSSASFSPSDIEDLRFLNTTLHRSITRRVAKSQSFTLSLPNTIITVPSSPIPFSPVHFLKPTVFRGRPQINYGVTTGARMDQGSRGIVAEAARLACRVAGHFAIDRGLPMVHRAALAPPVSEEDMAAALAARMPTGYVDFVELNRHSIPVPYGINTMKPVGHWTLGIPSGEGYVRATSPLRRYTDLVAHWQIKNALLHPGEKPLFSSEHMGQLVFEAELRERLLKRINRAHTQFWALRRVMQEIEQPSGGEVSLDNLEGYVLKAKVQYDAIKAERRRMVMLPQLGLQAWMVTERDTEYAVGSQVRVAASDVNFMAVPRLIVRPSA